MTGIPIDRSPVISGSNKKAADAGRLLDWWKESDKKVDGRPGLRSVEKSKHAPVTNWN